MTDPPPPGTPGQRRLDRAPGERYRGGRPPASTASAPAAGSGSRRRGLVAATATAAVGAIVYALLGEINLDPGLVIVAAVVGWAVALALIWGAGVAAPIPRQALIAAAIAGGAIVAGLLLAWAISRVEGGVLDPVGYTNERYGPLASPEIGVDAGLAWLRAR